MKYIKDKEIGKSARGEIIGELSSNKRAIEFFNYMENDRNIQTLLEHGNTVAIGRLNYNDHGLTHSRISSLNALRILKILNESGITPTLVKEHTGTYEDSQVAVLGSAYLHDIGNAVHRNLHYFYGPILINSFLENFLPKIYNDIRKAIKIRASILEYVYTHDENVQCISIEGGCVSVGDGTDMANGRARVPFSRGKFDIHSLSALAIESVKIKKGNERPVLIEIGMRNHAGIFQVQEVLGPKIKTSSIEKYIAVLPVINGKALTHHTF
ncbi:MAG: HD domain-containing protein [Candidatus Thermoplasmatota archaeon]